MSPQVEASLPASPAEKPEQQPGKTVEQIMRLTEEA
jgi:hypothetical protein